jgi:hypothetical protein
MIGCKVLLNFGTYLMLASDDLYIAYIWAHENGLYQHLAYLLIGY